VTAVDSPEIRARWIGEVGVRSGLTWSAVSEYVDQHLGDVDLTADTVANALHVSTRTVNRIFRLRGLTFREWLRTCRLERSREALVATESRDVSISKIAMSCGMSDLSQFSKYFKARFGVSPSTYRRDAA
jgi:AraC-like DNA-binding protein